MTANTERFTGRVAAYTHYRERYDAELVLPLLRSWCGLRPQWMVADVGAGTGMLSDVFLVNGNAVIAVEPNAEMRDECVRLHTGVARLQVVAGTAEATGLPDACVEMVSVGRAMHWFDLERAMGEFRRILKPAGWVAIVSYGRARDGRAENMAFEEFLRPYTPGQVGTHSVQALYRRLEGFFAPESFHRTEIRGEVLLGWEMLRGMTRSLSYAPLPGEAGFAEFEETLEGYFACWERAGEVLLETRYWVNAGRFD